LQKTKMQLRRKCELEARKAQTVTIGGDRAVAVPAHRILWGEVGGVLFPARLPLIVIILMAPDPITFKLLPMVRFS